MVADTAMALPLVGVGHPQGTDRAAAKLRGGVQGVSLGDAAEPVLGAGADISRALADDRDIAVGNVPRRQQRRVQRHGLIVAAEGLAAREGSVDEAGGLRTSYCPAER